LRSRPFPPETGLVDWRTHDANWDSRRYFNNKTRVQREYTDQPRPPCTLFYNDDIPVFSKINNNVKWRGFMLWVRPSDTTLTILQNSYHSLSWSLGQRLFNPRGGFFGRWIFNYWSMRVHVTERDEIRNERNFEVFMEYKLTDVEGYILRRERCCYKLIYFQYHCKIYFSKDEMWSPEKTYNTKESI
jgi:hypothetical protein